MGVWMTVNLSTAVARSCALRLDNAEGGGCATRRDVTCQRSESWGEIGSASAPLLLVFIATTKQGLTLSTFALNLSALCGIGGARRGCVACVKVVLGGV